MTNDKAIEAAARAMYESQPHYRDTAGTRVTWDDFPCNDVEPRRYWLNMARAALAAAEAEAWRPISSAPVGVPVMVTGHVINPNRPMPETIVATNSGDDEFVRWYVLGTMGLNPTHWRPLPAPPPQKGPPGGVAE